MDSFCNYNVSSVISRRKFNYMHYIILVSHFDLNEKKFLKRYLNN